MPDMEILNERPITANEVLAKLEEISKKQELNARAAKTKEHLNIFIELKIEQVKELQKKLESLDIPRLKDRHIVKIINMMPNDIDQLRILFLGETISLKQEDLTKIIEVVKQYKNVKTKK